MGTVTGLLVMVASSLGVLFLSVVLGLDQTDVLRNTVLAFALFFSQLIAGYVGGRLTSADQPAFHGAQSGLVLYAIVTILTLAGGSPAGSFTLVLFALVALVIGYAGGALGGRPREDQE